VTSDDTRTDQTRRDDVAAEMAAARQRLLEIPVEVHVWNHLIGLIELAKLHLEATPANLAEAALAINAVGCLVEGLDTELGADHGDAKVVLSQLRLAFVQIKGAQTHSSD
jgi:hypothetical protein